ncbi:putative hydrolase [Diplonema papillatum]|nr:putative hydrolase [Diplonema papillatum]
MRRAVGAVVGVATGAASFSSFTLGKPHAMAAGVDVQNVEVVFLGTGSSVAVPQLRCLLSAERCDVCAGASEGNRNKRGNPSLLLRVSKDGRAEKKNVLIDCGKTFRDSTLRFFEELGARYVDAVILTHYHADAVLGLDDIRDYQPVIKKPDLKSGLPASLASTPVYCDSVTLDSLKGVFPYLMPKTVEQAKEKILRFTSALDWNIFEPMQPLEIEGLKVTPLPVIHGKDCVAFGFEVLSSQCRLVYLSDVSTIPEETHKFLSEGKRIDVFVVDALFKHRPHNTHFSLPQALETVKLYAPAKTYFTGMSHELDYYKQSEFLTPEATGGNDVEMGYDGMTLVLPLLDVEPALRKSHL